MSNPKYTTLKRNFSLSINKNKATISDLNTKIDNINNEFKKLDLLIVSKINEKKKIRYRSKFKKKTNVRYLVKYIIN